eukprot:scpid52902/ scgid5456/ Sodium-dependent phosphate transport protein 2B; Na(+)-dependent phosphate cotransporter 2B; Sodium/phosphate cotransporter 2B; Solute carrier family 34 member 2
MGDVRPQPAGNPIATGASVEGEKDENKFLLAGQAKPSDAGSVSLAPMEEVRKSNWKYKSKKQQARTVAALLGKLLVLITALYFFICSLGILSDAFQLVGGREAGDALGESSLFVNPLAGLMIGVIATVLLQSSSTTTSIIVALTASGVIQKVEYSIPIVMGANIGTSVTNTIVSIGQIGDREQFKRAFAGATVHDMFNFLSVLVLLPVEAVSHYLFYLTEAIVNTMSLTEEANNQEFLSVLTDPFIELFVQLNRSAIIENARGNHTEEIHLLKQHCGILQEGNCTVNETVAEGCVENIVQKCDYAFFNSSLSERAIGVIMLLIALFMLITALLVMVKALRSVLGVQLEGVVKKAANGNLPGKARYLTPYLAILIGAGVTMLVQSSSVFTSTLTPLVGIGILDLERMLPLTVGSNIGTTFTGILAALALKGEAEDRRHGFQVAFAHLFFNISGLLVWYPIPAMRNVVLGCARFMGETTAKYRWFAILYLILAFLLIPGLVFGLSLGGWQVMVGVLAPVFFVFFLVWLLNMLQKHRRSYLPVRLQTWDFLPLWLTSLQPYDAVISKVLGALRRRKKSYTAAHDDEDTEDHPIP